MRSFPKIVLIEKTHKRKDFQCEVPSLNSYLKTQVNQDIKKNLATCFVATNSQNEVIGYYTLTSYSLGREIIPKKFLKKLPSNYTAPVILLGRLARHLNQRGTGLGEHLLIDALIRSYTVSAKSIGAMAVVADPIDSYVETFYKKYGFIKLPGSGKMFLPMKVIEQLI